MSSHVAPRHASALLAALLVPLLAAPAAGQMFYGHDGGAATVWESTFLAGPPCPQPNPVRLPCVSTGICGLPAPFPVGPADPLVGAICTDTQTNTIFYTDGAIIHEVAARGPCTGPGACPPVNSFVTPLPGPASGLALDETGAILGFPRTLFITDGFAIVGVVPGPCAFTVVFGPCLVGLPVPVPLTGLTFDPVTATLWACDGAGLVHNIAIAAGGGCTVVASFPPAGVCIPAGSALTGITYDLATPDLVTGGPPALFVTDGFVIEAIDAIGGAPAPPTFYAPSPCTVPNAPLNGLAFNLNGIGYGTPRVSATLGSWGQSSTPGPTFGLEILGSPPAPAFLILNFNVPGPGFFCPGVAGVGTVFWVDPGAGSLLVPLGVLPPGCVPVPLPLPPALPPGLRGFFQVIYKPPGPAVDATNGLSLTIGLP